MHDEPEKSYPDLPALSEDALDPNSSYSKILELVDDGCRVLDVGCASGYLAKLLAARGNRVTGLDISTQALELAVQYCDRIVQANLDEVALSDLFERGSFDAIIFADVLEHLRSPWNVLDDARSLLGYRGHAIVSIPNIAHGAIRLALLKGHFDYSEFGILDNTHLRFFTRRTVQELFVQCGYEIERTEKTVLPLFVPTNLVPDLDPADFEPATVEKIRNDPDADTLQFVIRARALDDNQKLTAITQHYLSANAELEAAKDPDRANEHFSALLAAAAAENQLNRETIAQLQEERIHYRELQQREAGLQLALADVADSIAASVRELEARNASSNDELRLQRQAYDELCAELSSARRMVARSEQVLAFDLIQARSFELSAMLAKVLAKKGRYRAALRNSTLWRALVAGRRALVRLRR